MSSKNNCPHHPPLTVRVFTVKQGTRYDYLRPGVRSAVNLRQESELKQIKEYFTEDSLQFHQAEVSFKTHKEFVGHSAYSYKDHSNYTLHQGLSYVIASG